MTENYLISFKNTDKEVLINASNTILDAAWQANLPIDAPCGGNGRCYKCKFRLLEGKVSAPVFVEPDIYLACKATPITNCVIEITSTAQELTYNENFADVEFLSELKSLPTIEKHVLDLGKVQQNYTQRDLIKLIKFNFPNINLNDTLYSLLPKENINSQGEITLTIRNGSEIIDIEPANTKHLNFALAIDLGTTTIDVLLVDLNTSKILIQKSMYNAQRSYGEDIISRIIYSEKHNDTTHLQKAAIKTINKIIESIIAELVIDFRNIYAVSLAGNTTMSYLLTNQNPAPIRCCDNVDLFNEVEIFNGGCLGLMVNINTNVLFFPAIASFVGGDITAGILSSQLFKSDKLTLLVDIGTNGELVLGNSEWMLSCSCSAGPAFEGSSVSCGTRFMPGAINSLTINPENLEVAYKTYMDKPPVGICGTALIDLVAQMLDAKIIDRQGKIDRTLKSSRIREKGNIYEYVVVFSENDMAKIDITIDENDIHNLIRAKAAIFAGIVMLLKSVDLTLQDLEEVIVAGTFGKHIQFENAIKIGLLPEIAVEKYKFLGNTSLFGAYQLLRDKTLGTAINSIVTGVTYLDLSSSSEYMDLYMAGLFLPHTDLSLFSQR